MIVLGVVATPGPARGGGRSGIADRSPSPRRGRRPRGSVRFVTATLRRNLRLLVGMVRANEPSRMIARRSRVLVAALGTAAFSLATSDVWRLADHSRWPRVLALALGSVAAISVALVIAHGLWGRDAPRGSASSSSTSPRASPSRSASSRCTWRCSRRRWPRARR
jgi:hypothetical protein